MIEAGNHSETIGQIAQMSALARRRDLLRAVVHQVGWVVQDGPFAGMTLPEAWGDGALLPKLLGCYEAELHPVLAEIAGAEHDLGNCSSRI